VDRKKMKTIFARRRNAGLMQLSQAIRFFYPGLQGFQQ
jgi:hypothetical protein